MYEIKGLFAKEELVKILEANREKHHDIFVKALRRYSEMVIDWHKVQVLRIEQGDLAERSIRLPQPEDHTDDYDTIILMLKMHKEDTIELDAADFRNLVQDKWSWSQAFAQNTSSYVTGR